MRSIVPKLTDLKRRNPVRYTNREQADLLCIKRIAVTAGYFLLFYIFLTVHLRIILVGNHLEAQFPLQYVYLNPLHVSWNSVLILRTIVLTLKTLN